jgi:hypothetical protein
LLNSQAHADREVRREVYFLDETDKRIFRYLYQVSQDPQLGIKAKTSARLVSTLYDYRTAAAKNLASNLQALGLEKAPPKAKTLEEILNEPEESVTKRNHESVTKL